VTDLRLPPLVVDHSLLWLQVDLSGNQDWAWRAAAQLLARPQWAQYRTARGEKQLTALMKRAAAIASKQAGASLGFILFPSPEERIKGMAILSPVDLDSQAADEALTELVEQLVPRLPVGSEPEITRMQTPAGECQRLRLRYAADGEPEGRVGEQIGYLWLFEGYSAACLLMSFTSVPEAARWLPALDQLASGVRLQRSGDEPSLTTLQQTAAPGPGGVIEIRPVRPDGKLLPGERAILTSWVLAADPHFGTLTLSVSKRGKPQVFQLPSTGSADAVATVCLATHQWHIGQQSGSTWRMLFLDRENRLVGAGQARDHPQALRLFPAEVFDPLKAVGIDVVSQWYDTTQALEDACPGAVGKVALAGERQRKMAAVGLTAALVILAIIAVAVYLATH
jgi:hypothetical protein